MFSTFKQRLLLGVYILIILSIPVGAYLVSQQQTIKSSASETKVKPPIVKITPPAATSSAQQLLDTSRINLPSPSLEPSPSPSSPTITTSFGPTLSLKVNLEARPKNNQATKLFVGIIEGSITSSPKFLLSFTVDLPSSGEYTNLSLAGLTAGSTYTAILKGSAQIANSSTFSMSPTVTNLNDGQVITLLSGDLNEYNVINSPDYSIAQNTLNATSTSPNWNENADLNKDGLINVFDLAIITKNMGQTGASGAWTSPIPKVGAPVGSPGEGGYWIWLPK